MQIELTTESAQQTEALAVKIGSHLKGGEIFELISDLGGGKTTFARGLCAGAGSKDLVNSPTFTITKQYSADDLTIYHFDFYRLNQPGLVVESLLEAIQDSKAVILIEWAQTVRSILPKNTIMINIEGTKDSTKKRRFTIKYRQDRSYLFKDVQK